jgi:uncharacterized SAM-binding protein YcdF (DUF218 family)
MTSVFNMGFIISKTLLLLLLPPASLLVLILAGLILLRRHRGTGRVLVAAGISLLYLLSLEPVSDRLIRPLEAAYPPLHGVDIKADAVVVLGSGVNDLSWLPAGPEPSPSSLQRLVEGIRIARNLRIPLVVSGGSGALAPAEAREADAMAALAVKLEFPRGDIIVENRSRNTWENAEQVKGLISGRTIVLVTSAFHLKRAAGMFRKQGFSVNPAPAAYKSASRPLSITALLPRADALETSSTALAEYFSLAWYWSFGKL